MCWRSKGKEKGGDASKNPPAGKGSFRIEDQPPTFFTEKQADGYQRALCSSFILTGTCKWGDDCVYAKHGGHPARVTDELKKVLEARNARSAEMAQQRYDYTKRQQNIAAKRRIEAGEE